MTCEAAKKRISMSKQMKILSIFNNEGGVGKMTLTDDLACALAEFWHKVLMLDANPQCGLKKGKARGQRKLIALYYLCPFFSKLPPEAAIAVKSSAALVY